MLQLFLAGDVMTGRGIDQALGSPGDPRLHEPYVRDARDYIALAERAHGAIARPMTFEDLWGDALAELERAAPDARIVNLETSITTSDRFWPNKSIHYRMHPANVGCLKAARLDCCVLANNHVLDFGREGLVETLASLDAAGLACAGAGHDAAEAAAPCIIDLSVRRARVLVAACGAASSGIPTDWGATVRRAGVQLVAPLCAAAARRFAAAVERTKRPRDVVVASVHWGPNWGYGVPAAEREFAHALIDSGAVDVVHGHSAHHAKGIEVYRGKPILYGCGDLLNDYEGISGHAGYRADLALLYFVRIDSETGRLAALEVVPLVRRRFALRAPSHADAEWVAAMLEREGSGLGTHAGLRADGRIELRFAAA